MNLKNRDLLINIISATNDVLSKSHDKNYWHEPPKYEKKFKVWTARFGEGADFKDKTAVQMIFCINDNENEVFVNYGKPVADVNQDKEKTFSRDEFTVTNLVDFCEENFVK